MRTSTCTIFLFYQGNNIKKSIEWIISKSICDIILIQFFKDSCVYVKKKCLFLWGYSRICMSCPSLKLFWLLGQIRSWWLFVTCIWMSLIVKCLWGFTWKSCMGLQCNIFSLINEYWRSKILIFSVFSVILDKYEHTYAVNSYISGMHRIGIELNADCIAQMITPLF